jgi:uncharacterized protein (AIM24 family)
MQAEVRGSTMPVLEVVLDVGEAVVSDHGGLSWMTANMQMTQTASTGSAGGGGGLLGGLKRLAGGGSILLTRYEPMGGTGMVAFAAKLPGHIVALDVAPGQAYLVHRHGWLCGTPGVVPSVALQQSLGGMIFGGEGFVLQRLEGEGTAWIELSGELTTYDLAPGQQLLVHPGHIGCFSESVQFQVSRIPGIVNRWAGGDGHWIVVLTGPGKVWLQSMPLPILASALSHYLGNNDAAAGALAGGAAGGLKGAALGGVLGDILGH